MYYCYAEKKGSLFSGWSMREVALDCSRRYFYYSEPVKESLIVPCSGPPIVVFSDSSAGLRKTSISFKDAANNDARRTEERNPSSAVSDGSRSRPPRTSLSAVEMESASSSSFAASVAHSPSSSPLQWQTASEGSPNQDSEAAVPPALEHSSKGSTPLQREVPYGSSLASSPPQALSSRLGRSPLRNTSVNRSITGGGISGTALPTSSSGSGGGENATSPRHANGSGGRRRYPTPPPPHSPHAVVWKRKIKIDCFACAAHNHEFKTYDPHLKENDFYQIELGGESRTLSKGEIPPPEPLLCSSAGLSGMPGRCVLENDEFIRDPFFQKELYDSLKTLFSNIRLEQYTAAMRENRPFELPMYRTITSPRGSGGKEDFVPGQGSSHHNSPTSYHARGGDGGSDGFPSGPASSVTTTSHTNGAALAQSTSSNSSSPSGPMVSFAGKILGKTADRVYFTFRFRTEYEFRRFFYVLKTVLGYDKLTLRPYRGFPPYDPRNGIILAHLPLYRWHSFKCLQKSMIYSFVRGDLYGRTMDNSRTVVLLKGGFLCMNHDSVVVLRDEGRAFCKLRLLHVEHFRYNYDCSHPYCAFISDVGHTDIFFVPQPPLFGEDSISRFYPKEEVMRIRRLVYETCFCSLGIRRVIDLKEVLYPNILVFIDAYIKEFERIRVDYLNPMVPYTPTNESFPSVWGEAQGHIRQLRHARLSNFSESAIPLYENHTNHLLSNKKLEAIRHRIAERTRAEQQDEIIGIAVEEGDSGEDSFSRDDERSREEEEEEVPSCFQEMTEYTRLPEATS